jgi:hypothetical protein
MHNRARGHALPGKAYRQPAFENRADGMATADFLCDPMQPEGVWFECIVCPMPNRDVDTTKRRRSAWLEKRATDPSSGVFSNSSIR